METSEIIVKGQEIPLLKAPDFKIPLYPHQAYAANWISDKRNNSYKSLIIEAPTGGGKTLAALASIIRIVESKENAVVVFIYPTNELLKNQIASINKSLKQLGFRPKVFGISEQQKDKGSFDASIIEGTGEALHTLALLNARRRQRTEIPSFGHIFSRLLEYEAKIKILATNPDVLYLLASAKYSSAPRLITEAANADLFVIDEFHAYFGVSLANLLYTLKMIDLLGGKKKKKYLFLSATPSPKLLDIINQLFGPYKYVRLSDLLHKASREKLGLRYDEAGKRKISYDVTLRLLPEKSLDDLSFLNAVVRQTLDRYDRVKSNFKDEVVPSVVIVNSVLDAVNIADTLKDNGFNVSQIHGLTPKQHRKIVGDVVVGTSAIELGIDFQAYSVIFEGREASAFLQRLGRVGRHFPGEATAFVPERILEKGWASECGRDHLADLVNAIFVKSDNYPEFVKSPQGMELLAAITRNLISGLGETEERNSFAEAKENIIKHADHVKNSLGIQGIVINLLMSRNPALSLAEKPSQRGGAPSVIVFIENYQAALSLDIVDAFRKLENLKEFDENSLQKILNEKAIDNETKVLLMYGKKAGFKIFKSSAISRQRNKIAIASSYHGSSVKAASQNSPLSIVINDQANIASQQILEGTLYCVSNIYQDWRLNPVPIYESGQEQLYVILGANSLVSNWLLKSK
ncbi:MAG: type I-D CRISPR-associated helicase Cas3' [Thermoproteota archaeon]